MKSLSLRNYQSCFFSSLLIFSILCAKAPGAGPAWTWVSGNNIQSFSPVYGTRGVADPANRPGYRNDAILWTDAAGRLWLFGGIGPYPVSNFLFNDLWRFDPATGMWTWVKGSDRPNQPAVYGTQGTADPANTPGARAGSSSWIDASGRLWLFGGMCYNNKYHDLRDLNDLWRFDPATGTWTWMKGESSGTSQAGIYGTQGVAAPANTPGSRYLAASWTGTDGRFWIYGGYYNYNSVMCDLWCFDPATNNWTWVKGSQSTNQPGVYGTRGIAAAANQPGARIGAATWTGEDGRLWFFGGDSSSSDHHFKNDLWCFDPASGNWVWVAGSNQISPSGVYGTRGVAAAANTPGGRAYAAAWTGADGTFWLFGGVGFNDLWRFDPASGYWTWVKGSNQPYQAGVFSALGVAAESNTPGGRYGAAAAGRGGSFWLFGGNGFFTDPEDLTTDDPVATLNDLWRFDTATGNWTPVMGNNRLYAPGSYGAAAVEARTNAPAPRVNAAAARDAAGRLYCFGGRGVDGAGVTGRLNDLWRFDPATGIWTWLKGSNRVNQAGVYGTQGAAAAANTPGARLGAATWSDAAGRIWLFGGDEGDASGSFNDLWRFDPATGNWTWLKGSSEHNQASKGVLGSASSDSTPGARSGAATWIDKSGRLWLFGGTLITHTENWRYSSVHYNDLWRYDPATGNWTWVKGSNIPDNRGVMGTQGVPAPANNPASRAQAATWIGPDGRFWLFGGQFDYNIYNESSYNDLWVFDPATTNWTWVKTGKSAGGTYGTMGTESPDAAPGGRYDAASWSDGQGRLWLLGGCGSGSSSGNLNDLWCYNIATGNWAWMHGSAQRDALGVYGTRGALASANDPGARHGAAAVAGKDGRLWLLGGDGLDANGGQGLLNDLWVLNVSSSSADGATWRSLE